MAKAQTTAVPEVDQAVAEQVQAEMDYLLFDAPIAELAESQGISIDEAVKLRVEKSIEAAPLPMEVSVRPIEPQGKLIGFASVKFGAVTVDDFKIYNGEKGLFVSMPSKPDPGTRTGYRATVRIPDQEVREQLNAAAAQSYNRAVEKLIARAEAVRPAPIREQMEKAAKEADRANEKRSEPAKGKEARDDR